MTKMLKVKVNPAPEPGAGSVRVGVNGQIVTVPLHVETEVGEDVYEALQNSGYDVSLLDDDGNDDGVTTSRYTDVPLGEDDRFDATPESEDEAKRREAVTQMVDEANSAPTPESVAKAAADEAAGDKPTAKTPAKRTSK